MASARRAPSQRLVAVGCCPSSLPSPAAPRQLKSLAVNLRIFVSRAPLSPLGSPRTRPSVPLTFANYARPLCIPPAFSCAQIPVLHRSASGPPSLVTSHPSRHLRANCRPVRILLPRALTHKDDIPAVRYPGVCHDR
ncbi:hypothetical protein OH76DRAFT_1254940 [Lentinus brumalis]|uniref:Uncharacterized protein n=1 Tax=Lentinus brumalis TaxID=2498619 RepID=A0A371CRI9_9APHY|nr:hypothetical protein OH76DRAFT_1254940 [Polyporus brumalis]